jgi:hypothetical protein
MGITLGPNSGPRAGVILNSPIQISFLSFPIHATPNLFEKVGNSEKSSNDMKNGQFEKKEEENFMIRSVSLQDQPISADRIRLPHLPCCAIEVRQQVDNFICRSIFYKPFIVFDRFKLRDKYLSLLLIISGSQQPIFS